MRDLRWWLRTRDRLCRLSPGRALATLDQAAGFLRERGMVTLTADSWLPSLFQACHEEPYRPQARGFGSWPRTKWMWGSQLGTRPDVITTRLHRGKLLYVGAPLEPALAALCRKSAAEAAGGALGPDAARLMSLLAGGPLLLEQIHMLGVSERALRRARTALQRTGAIFTEEVLLEGREGGHRHSARLMRADDRFASNGLPIAWEDGLTQLVVAAVRAAVVAPVRDVVTWFSFPTCNDNLDRALQAGRLIQPEPGWVAYDLPSPG